MCIRDSDISTGVTGFSRFEISRPKNLGVIKFQRQQACYKPRRTAAKSGVEILPNDCENANYVKMSFSRLDQLGKINVITLSSNNLVPRPPSGLSPRAHSRGRAPPPSGATPNCVRFPGSCGDGETTSFFSTLLRTRRNIEVRSLLKIRAAAATVVAISACR